MRSVLLVFFVSACINIKPSSSLSIEHRTVTSRTIVRRSIDAAHMFGASSRLVHETPLYLLISNEASACVVDIAKFNVIRLGDYVPCSWTRIRNH